MPRFTISYNWITGKFSFDDSQYPTIELLVNSVLKPRFTISYIWITGKFSFDDSQYPTIELLVNSVMMIHNILQLNYW
jgi:hypothetical protein